MPDSTASSFPERPSHPSRVEAPSHPLSLRFDLISLAFALVAVSLIGCKRETATSSSGPSEAAPTAAAPPGAAPAPAAPAANPPAAAAEAAAPTDGASAPQPAGAAPSDAPAVEPTAAAAAAAKPAELSDEVPTKPTRDPRGTCVRACNKSQKCGTTSEPVSECFGRCASALQAADGPDTLALKAAFLAGDQCADSPCTAFKACVDATAARESAYIQHPPISPRAAEPECKSACELEKRCNPDIHDDRPSGFEGCIANCQLVLTHVDPRVAEERARWRTRVACARDAEACDAIEACVAQKVPAAAPSPAAPEAPQPPEAAPPAPEVAPPAPEAVPPAAPAEAAPTPP